MANELILIIEDNEVNRVLVRDMLRFKGYQTLEAQSAEEGIRVARGKKPALILMDFHLPKMNGIEALQALRADAWQNGEDELGAVAQARVRHRHRALRVWRSIEDHRRHRGPGRDCQNPLAPGPARACATTRPGAAAGARRGGLIRKVTKGSTRTDDPARPALARSGQIASK